MRIILLIDCAFYKGGAERVAWLSAQGLAVRGHQVTALCGAGPVLPELQNIPNLEIICLGQSEILHGENRVQAALQGLWNRPAQAAMLKILAACDPADTLVHAHSWTHALSSSPLKAAIKSNFPVLVTLHDYFTACPNGGFYDFQAQKICTRVPLSLSCLCTHCDQRKFAHKVYRVARQVVQTKLGKVPSGVRHFAYLSQLSRSVLEPYLPRAANFYAVENPIDLPRETPVNVAANNELMFIGRLVPEKRPQLLAAAAKELNCPVTFVGDGPLAETIRSINPAAADHRLVAAGANQSAVATQAGTCIAFSLVRDARAGRARSGRVRSTGDCVG